MNSFSYQATFDLDRLTTIFFSWAHHGSVREGFEASLKALDVGYIDLYLMHWPQGFNQKGTLPHFLTNKLLTSEKKNRRVATA